MKTDRNIRIDALKGIAIIAVVLYHFGGGYLTYGYFGVDIFFVISGYFMMKSIAKTMHENSFNYRKFEIGKIARLWSMVVLWAAVALVVGLFVMLPDDLENLSESVIASNMFANNVLACITTRNYWDIVNTFKPLMHTWYLGVLMQAYVGLPLLYLGVFKFVKNMKAVKISLIIITLLSLIAYLLPIATTAEKFYYLPYRAFEITLGSLVAFAPPKRIEKKILYTVELICIAVVLFILCANFEYSTTLKQLLVVCATVVLVYVFVNTNEKTMNIAPQLNTLAV